jgi:hypothetical protein
METKEAACKKSKKTLKHEFSSKMNQYIGAGFGLVAGLAWNDAIKSLIDTIFPQGSGGSLLAKFIYAFIMTLVVVIISFYISRIFKKEEK